MLVTSLLAGAFVALLRHGRRRTVLRPGSRDYSHDDDVTVEIPTMIGGDWQLHRPDVASTTLDGDWSINTCQARKQGVRGGGFDWFDAPRAPVNIKNVISS